MNYTHFAGQEFPQGKPTMYQPTEQELLEMGFERENVTMYRKDMLSGNSTHNIRYDILEYIWSVSLSHIYPTSKSDIETLIRLFSNP